MRLTYPRVPAPDERCDDSSIQTPVLAPPAFVVPNENGRLIRELRDVLIAHPSEPAEILAEAAIAFVRFGQDRGFALADLAVSGQQVFTAFCAQPPTDAQILQIARQTVSDPGIAASVSQILDRAYKAAWVLRGFGNRNDFGWIAVSGEDDPPHRPVNSPASRYPQYDLDVIVRPTTNARGRTVRTRFIVASANRYSPPPGPAGGLYRVPPPDRAPEIGLNERIVIYVHGHTSQAEECEDLAPQLVRVGFCVIAMDLPCNGYASMFDHTEIGDDQHTDQLEVFPILEFIEQFILDFVQALEIKIGRPLQDQIAAIIGGSLGGNMGLRLAQRDPTSYSFLSNVVSWSPASVWNPLTGLIFERGPNDARYRMRVDPPPTSEDNDRRNEYFRQCFVETIDIGPVNVAQPQSYYWYRNDWEPCKRKHIVAAVVARQEIYNRFFRRWHWRLVLEQLLFSHPYKDRYKKIASRVLLISGEEDGGLDLYKNTQNLSDMMLNTPGTRVLLKHTGHSIHNERPAVLAQAIHDFVPPHRPGNSYEVAWMGWQPLGGAITSRPAVAVNEDGRIDVFARSTDNQIWHIMQSASGDAWSQWERLDQGLAVNDVFGDSIGVGINYDGRLEVFAQLSHNKWIAHVWQTAANSGWGSWDKGNNFGQLIGDAEDGVCVEERFGTDAVDAARRFHLLAARRVNGRIHIRGQNSAGWWTNGRDLGRSTPGFVGTPALVRNQDGRLEVYARDGFGNVYHIWETSPDNWSDDWVPLPGCMLRGDVAVGRTIDGRIMVFGQGTNGALWQCSQIAPNGGMGLWASLGGSLSGSTPAVALNGWNELEVFVRWADGSIRGRRLQHNPGWLWNDWQNLGGTAVRDPVVGPNVNGTLVVFCVGTDRQLYANAQTVARSRTDISFLTPLLLRDPELSAPKRTDISFLTPLLLSGPG